ncbi:transcription factor bHLH118-like [Cucurbita moschata]|uniref:Transcription factor bHLH118-like n=1 Tax=Cucurbita moschata TaxID=3662 RepID=A0A6J1E8G7_CUCMO|nr:transcription factor bHLH118-like [Cucurbita moschata]
MEFNIESPISFDLGDELFPLPSISSCIDNISVPQFPSISPLENDKSASKRPKRSSRRNPPPNASNDENPNDQKRKKIMHRDVERQRRQEMSSLYSSLRSLLPLEYLKGKPSISDHMHETVKYIQYMQRRIRQLSDKRDELKNLSGENMAVGMVETLNSSRRDSVVVRSKNGLGIQVVLDTTTQHRLPVSNILRVLAVEGLEILSCITIKVNERYLHTIECQVESDGFYPSIDVCELQHKLTNLEYLPLD